MLTVAIRAARRGLRAIAIAGALAALGCDGAAPAPASEGRVAAESPPPAWVDVDATSLGPMIRAHPARVLLVNVWSTWCEPCVEEMPAVIATARAHEARGLGLVLIAVDAPANRDAAQTFLRAQGAPRPSWFKVGPDDPFIRALHPDWSGGLPATLLLDEERRVAHFWEEPVTAQMLRGPLESLLGGEG